MDYYEDQYTDYVNELERRGLTPYLYKKTMNFP